MAGTPKEQPKPVLWASTGCLLDPLTVLPSTSCERITFPFVVWPKRQVLSRIPKVRGIFQEIPVFLPFGPASQTSELPAPAFIPHLHQDSAQRELSRVGVW